MGWLDAGEGPWDSFLVNRRETYAAGIGMSTGRGGAWRGRERQAGARKGPDDTPGGIVYPESMSPDLPPMKPIVVTVTGPSSAGKTVLSNALASHGFEPLVSTTTRPIRKGEKDGRDYHFVSRAAFEQMLQDNALIEDVVYDGNYYGVSAQEAMRAFEQGKPAVLVAEPHGCQQIHDLCQARGWTVLRVFVNNPIPVLIDRMLKRFYEDVRDFDLDTPQGRQSFQDKVDTHGKRIEKIMGQEQREWVAPAYSGQVEYDLIIDEFNSDNQAEALARVEAMVQEHRLQADSPRRSKAIPRS